MNPNLQICHKCNEHNNIIHNKGNVHINCQYGYSYSMKNNANHNQFNHNKPNNIPNDNKPFSDIITDINKAYKHLLTYFKTVKDENINELFSLINKIESSYEKSYKRNKKMLSFLQILIDNYDGSIEMKNTIMSNKINIYQCGKILNLYDLIEYFNEYNIIEKKKRTNAKDFKCIKTITEHTSSVFSLLLLKDKRIASCSRDRTIRIYDPSNDYHCDQVIERHKGGIFSICVLDDGSIVSCSGDKSIIIGDYIIKDAHDFSIFKVITLSKNRLASCSFESTIKIWKSDPPYSNTPLKVLEGHHQDVTSLLYIKERDIMISGSEDRTLRLWTMSTYQCDKVIKGVECCSTNSLYQIDNNRVIVGGKNTFTMVNIDECVIVKTIKDNSLSDINCFLKLRDNHTILCGCSNGIFCFYDINTEEYNITKNNHKKLIKDLLMINDNTFLSCSDDAIFLPSSDDNTIKVWNY